MRSIKLFLHLFLLISILSGFNSQLLNAQDPEEAIADSTAVEPKTIELADISIKSGEAIVSTKRIVESLVAEETLNQLKQNTDSLLMRIDSLIDIESQMDYSFSNIRFLDNKLMYWYDKQTEVNDAKSSLADIIQDIDESKYHLESEIKIWQNTKSLIVAEESAKSVIGRINELTFNMDSVHKILIGKSDFVLKLLDDVTLTDVNIEDLITAIDNTIVEKKGKVFERNHASLFTISYSEQGRWKTKDPVSQFYHIELFQFRRYLSHNIPKLIFQIVLLILLIVVFIIIKRRLKNSNMENWSNYKKMLIRVFSKPVSSAILLGLFASILIFQNRPPIFRDTIILLATIPLIIILLSVSAKKYYNYIYLFGLLMFLREVYLIFPPENLFYRFSLLVIAIIENLAIVSLLMSFYKHPFEKKLQNTLILIILYLHLGFAFTGLFSIVNGNTMLSEITLNVTIVNTFAGFLLIVSTLIINGLLELTVDSKTFQRINVFRVHGQYLKKKITDLINLGAIIYWIVIMMRIVNIERPVIDGLTGFFTNELSIGSSTFTIGGIFIFFFVIWLSTVISKVIRVILEEDVLNNLNLAKGVPRTISVMIGYTLVTMGVFLAVSAAGIPMTSLTLIIGAFGVGIGFGLQNIFNNLVSGLILLFERPIQIDDTIEVGTLIGKVKSMGIRSSHVRTFDGAEVIVPNGNLISNEVVNWTLSDQQRRIEVIAGVAYGSDPYLVQKLFQKELDDHPDIMQDPKPSVFFQNMGESSLDFRLLFWTASSEWVQIRSEIIFKVHDILKENNIEIPFPQRDLHIRSIDQTLRVNNGDIEISNS